jgi:hypothetical protein
MGRGVETIEVASFRFRHEAEMVAGLLADAGIPAVVVGGDIGGAYPGIGTISVRVARADEARAREALDQDTPS